MRHFPSFAIVLTLLCVLNGCGRFNGEIVFVNESPQQVWVAKVEGFKHTPPAGILIPGAHKGASMAAMPYPEEIILRWSYEYDRADRTSVVSLRGVKPPRGRERLRFAFTTNREWVVMSEWGP